MQDNELSSKVLIALRRIMRAVDLHSKKLEKDYKLTGPQLLILTEIVKTDAITIGELATSVSLSNATITGIIDRLEKHGLARRIRGLNDRRQIFIEVTESCREILASAPPPLQEQFIERFEKLALGERKKILDSLEKVAAMMNVRHLEVAPMLSGQSLKDSDRNQALRT